MQKVFEKIIERLEKLKGYEANGDCPMDGMCSKRPYECTSCYSSTAIIIVKKVAEEYGNDFCEWFKYDYRTIAPKNHDVGNPYWRIPEDYSKLMFCPYCGKKIKVVE